MLVTLAVDHATRVLTVLADGAVDFEAIRGHLMDERTDGALGYRELIDARRAIPTVTGADLHRVVSLLRDQARASALGPTAVIVSSDAALGILRTLETLVADVAVIRPFRDYQEGVKWLTSQAQNSSGPGS